jgi:uncharacterized protein
MMITPAQSNFINRAVQRAALLFLCLDLLSANFAMTANAKMLQEKLWLATSQGEREISVEVTETPEDMSMGLMFRTSLPDNCGMLFPSPAPREASMWMRNTYIPLDMVFIRADGVIHRIETMTEPLSEAIIASNGEVLAVLELAGGAAARLGLKPGDRVRHRIFQSAR